MFLFYPISKSELARRCFCDGNTDGMSAAAEKAAQDIVELKSKLEAEKAEKTQLDQELVQHKLDREKAKGYVF